MTAKKTKTTPEKHICPFCRESIKKDAIKCKHCQTMLIPIENASRVLKAEEKPKPTTRIVSPDQYKITNDKAGHGIACLVISFIIFLMMSSIGDHEMSEDDINNYIKFSMLLWVLNIGYAIWTLAQENSKKSYPVFSLIMLVMAFIAMAHGAMDL